MSEKIEIQNAKINFFYLFPTPNGSFSLSFFLVCSVDARTDFLCFVYGLMAAKLEIPDCSWTFCVCSATVSLVTTKNPLLHPTLYLFGLLEYSQMDCVNMLEIMVLVAYHEFGIPFSIGL